MDRFTVGGTAGLAPRAGNVSDDEIAEFLARGGKVARVAEGVGGPEIRQRDVFGRPRKEYNVEGNILLDDRTDVTKGGAVHKDGMGRKILSN